MRLSSLHFLVIFWIFVTFSFSNTQAQDLNETHTLHFQNKMLKEVINTIGQTWNVSIIYSDSLIRADRRVHFSTEEIDFEATIRKLSLKCDLKWKLKGRQLILRPLPDRTEPEQPTRLEGYMMDSETGEPLPSGVVLLEGTRFGAIVRSNGHYVIDRFPPGTYVVRGSFLSYDRVLDTLVFAPGEQKNLDFAMKFASIELEQAIVISDRITDATTVSEVILETEDLRAVQGLSADPLRTISALPGFVGTGGIFGTSEISIRGGMPKEALFTIDNAPIPNPWHVTGNSILNSDIIKKVEVLTGGYPVTYGNSLSGVVNVEMEDGNDERFEGKLAVDAVNTKALIQGPILKKKLSFITSIRRSFFNTLFPKDGTPYPIYHDLAFKIGAKVHPNHKITLSGLGSIANLRKTGVQYHFGLPDDYRLSGSTNNSSLQWQGRLSDQIYHKLSFTGSYLEQTAIASVVRNDHFWQSTGNFREDITFFIGKEGKLRTGLESTFARYAYRGFAPLDPLESEYSDSSIAITLPDTFEHGRNSAAFYVLYEGKLLNRLYTNTGIRGESLADKKMELSPRVSLSYELGERTDLRASWGFYRQFPVNRALRNNPALSTSRAVHYILGLKYQLPSNVSAWVETYYKAYNNLVVYDEEMNYSNDGYGHAYGLEFFLRKKAGRLQGWISYALSRSVRRGDLQTRLFDSPFDRRHSLSIVSEYRIEHSSYWVPSTIAANFRFATGRPYTPVDSASFTATGWLGHPGIPYSSRAPAFDNLTLRAEWEKVFGKRQKNMFKWSLEIWNVYNKQNEAGRTPIYGYAFPNSVEELKYYHSSIFPWLGIEFWFR